MSKTYEEWLKYYANATKEQIIEDVEHDNLEIEKLTAESTEWESKCYRYQDILNELENLITLKIIRATNEEDYDIELDDMKELLSKLNELKGDSSNE